jgi:hypothetical protein
MSRKQKSRAARLRGILADMSGDDMPPLPPYMSLREARMLTEADDDESPDGEPPEICHAHGKRKFSTHNEAKRTIRFRQSRGAGRLRVYHCPECHRFHISSSFHQQHE